jgi:hypothetical protein
MRGRALPWRTRGSVAVALEGYADAAALFFTVTAPARYSAQVGFG